MTGSQTSDRLPTAIERQGKYLNLPDGFEFPLFNAGSASNHGRSGDRNAAAAARKIHGSRLSPG